MPNAILASSLKDYDMNYSWSPKGFRYIWSGVMLKNKPIVMSNSEKLALFFKLSYGQIQEAKRS